MRKLFVLFLAILMLCGCSKEKIYETISDGIEPPSVAKPLEMTALMPEGATSPVLATTDAGKLYVYENFTVSMQMVPAGDFSGLIRDITGYEKEKLQIMQSVQDGMESFQMVWTSVGEGQTNVGRANILTDGKYYYVMTAMVPENIANILSEGSLKEMFASFRAVAEEDVISSGS